ncbi:MAG TPA: ABC transporter ATP-binding protein [Tepidanaerobacteraceae bacterium]|nr:ABC transporter ATP-binding protein [Tepidanaerobacteraceae bacterium]
MILEMKNIVKVYDRVVANKNVSITLEKGEILAIVGENGAGKSTLMKILYGLERPNSGEIYINGKKQVFRNPSDAMKQGIGMVQQHFMLFDTMTVTENIIYNNEISKGVFLDIDANRKKVRELSKRYMLEVDPDKLVKDCPVGVQQRIEILKILHQNADILIFDEPSSVLTPIEVDELLKTMKRLSNMGKSIILITHKLGEVMEVADRIVVMRDGEVVAEKRREETSIEELSYFMIGRQTTSPVIKDLEPCKEVLSVKNLSKVDESGKKLLGNINISVRGGEIVGIAGVSGNGQSELIKCITGLDTDYTGKIEVCGINVTNKGVGFIRKAGLAHIPEDRYYWGSAKEATIAENVLMGDENTERFSKKGLLNFREIRKHVYRIVENYGIKVSFLAQKMKELSGGNAQKLIVAREIEKKTPFLVACEPTRGIDVGAMEFIHEKLIEKRNNGGGILLISSELSEILKLSDRIYVIYEGRIEHEFTNKNLDSRKLGFLMLGGKTA